MGPFTALSPVFTYQCPATGLSSMAKPCFKVVLYIIINKAMKTNSNITPNISSNARAGLILAGIVIALISAMALLHEIRSANNTTTTNALKTTTLVSTNFGLSWINKGLH
jgi:hypothetical protein